MTRQRKEGTQLRRDSSPARSCRGIKQ